MVDTKSCGYSNSGRLLWGEYSVSFFITRPSPRGEGDIVTPPPHHQKKNYGISGITIRAYSHINIFSPGQILDESVRCVLQVKVMQHLRWRRLSTDRPM